MFQYGKGSFLSPSGNLLKKRSSRCRVFAVMVSATASVAAARFAGAQTIDSWTSSSGGSWTTVSDWSQHALPGYADFNLNSTAGYTVNIPTFESVSSLNVDTDNVKLTQPASDTFSINLDSAHPSASGAVNVATAASDTAILTTSGGFFMSQQAINAGTNGGNGTLNLNGSGTEFIAVNGGLNVGVGTGSIGKLSGAAMTEFVARPGNSYTGPIASIGDNGGTGTVSLNNAGIQAYSYSIGVSGNGTLDLENNSVGDSLTPNIAGAINPADITPMTVGASGGTGTVTVNDTSSLSAFDVYVGESNGVTSSPTTGSITVSNSSTFTGGALFLGEGGTGSVSVVSSSTASFSASGNNYASVIGAQGGTGSVIVSGAGSSLTLGSVIVGEDSSGNAGSGTLQVDTGASLSATTTQLSPGATLNVLSGGTFSTNSINLNASSHLDITGGNLFFEEATLPAAGLTLPHTSTLGFGQLTGNLTNDGTVNVGTFGAAVSQITGNYTQDSDGLLTLAIEGYSESYEYSHLNVSGTATYGGTLQVSFDNGYEPVGGEVFNILSFGSEVGTFSSVELPALPDLLYWNTSQLYVNGDLIVVPEPATGALVIAAAVGFAGRRRCRS
jgi:T5SS/PEP-CTERM-associated repeat protein